MISSSDMTRLREIMPPHASAGDEPGGFGGLFPLGVTSLPSDYLEFMRIYGGGAVDDALVVAVPKASSGIGVPPIDIFEMTSDARLMWDREMSEDVNLESSSGVLSWGITSSSDILCWDASLDDPDSWPVVVFNRGRASWRRYECGMVKFIVGIFCREFDDIPIGEVSLWGNASPRFLNWREEIRLFESGVSPWTGRPIPSF
ncbi:hypothetical protein [Kitasatospora purpeofusca]|uniref:SMI1/KNR4 family protein n=1 Tax=Kitasatospora purpeofusca TaxID=67352 RepID=A0ABZ1U9R0_9ACTN|nr:hypothetical protein [Kitasatospora purpeofusca]